MANLRTAPAPEEENISKPVQCESCGKINTTDYMLQVMLGLSCTGHPMVLPIYCQASQHPKIGGHWSCPSEDCYLDVLTTCAKEHIVPMLVKAHSEVEK